MNFLARRIASSRTGSLPAFSASPNTTVHFQPDILGGGFDANRIYLYEGRPGTGKTTIPLQFFLKGARAGERVLCITLSETKRELELVAKTQRVVACRVDV